MTDPLPTFGPGDTVILSDPNGVEHQATVRSAAYLPSTGWCYTLLYQGAPGRGWWPEASLRIVHKL